MKVSGRRLALLGGLATVLLVAAVAAWPSLRIRWAIVGMGSDSWRTQVDAARVLQNMGPAAAEAVPTLVEAAVRSGSPETRACSLTALSRIGPDRPEVRSAARDLFQRDSSHWVRTEAARVLLSGGDPVVAVDVPFLIQNLDAPGIGIGALSSVCEGLARIGARRPEVKAQVLPVLEDLWKGSAGHEKWALGDALWNLNRGRAIALGVEDPVNHRVEFDEARLELRAK
jgi:hypothetical protein